MSALSLAYLGDAVYELLVRDYLVRVKNCPHKCLHKRALEFVAAPKQADAVRIITPALTQEEERVYKRGRNTKVGSIPHRATAEEYHNATGLETLFGYLYSKGCNDRISELFNMITGDNSDAL